MALSGASVGGGLLSGDFSLLWTSKIIKDTVCYHSFVVLSLISSSHYLVPRLCSSIYIIHGREKVVKNGESLGKLTM